MLNSLPEISHIVIISPFDLLILACVKGTLPYTMLSQCLYQQISNL